MYRSFYLIFIMLFAILVSATEIGDIENSDWYSNAIKNIKETEYYIKYNKKCNVYQSPNRSNNLRFTYYDNGFTVSPRNNSDNWDIDIRLQSYGSENQIQYYGKSIETISNTMTVSGNGLDIEYMNKKKGMRQNFIIEEQPEGNGRLTLNFTVEGNNQYQVNHDKVVFKNSNETIMEYRDLNIYDANNKELNGKFRKTYNGFKIIVDDINAVYPIKIDPLSAIPDWIGESNQEYASFGTSVSTAGDVNGDGYSDVIIGAMNYDNGEENEGAAFVYYGSITGLALTPDWIKESNQLNAHYGICVSTAGDINNDGYSDIIVGARGYSNGESSEGAAFMYYGSPLGLDTSYIWMSESNQDNACYGNRVSTAGDVNGDGFSDIMVAAFLYSNGEENEGRVYIYYGSLTGPSITPDWTTESNQISAHYGSDISTAGDINGDGYSDVIVGAYTYTNGEVDEGAAFVYYGSSTGLNISYEWMSEPNQDSAYYGYSVSTAGDINGDGYSDIIIGSHGYDNGQESEGAAFVYYGSATGLASTPDWMGESNQINAYYGQSLSCAGDVNGDGYSDIIIGAWMFDNGATDEGSAFVYYGSETGLPTTHDWMGESNQDNSYYGTSVSTAGDVNGDGFSDIIVGAPYYSNSESQEGTVFLFYGASNEPSTLANWSTESNQEAAQMGWSVSTAGDVNGDGYSDIIIGAPYYDGGIIDEGAAFVYYGNSSGLSDTPDWTGEGDGGGFGYSVSTAGDVNGDGYSDVIVGAFAYDNGETNEGAAFVYYGSASGLPAFYDWMGEGNQAGAYYGYSVSTAGDVNGDGYSDVIIGAYQYDNGKPNEGAAFVYYGTSAGYLSMTPAWMGESNQEGSNYGYSVSTAGDVNGDGYSDIIIGAPYYDGGIIDEGGAFVYYGSTSGLSENPDWIGKCNQADALYGNKLSTAGDVNGDGYSDVIVGAFAYDNGETNEGAAFVYYGSASGLPAFYDWMGEGNQAYAFYGYSVSTAGDVNGDGYSDVIIGAYGYDNGETNEGIVLLHYGSTTGLSITPEWMIEGNQELIWYGRSVSISGDVNGDGYSDVVVGIPWYDKDEINEGAVFLYYGNSKGVTVKPQQIRSNNINLIIAPLYTNYESRFKISLVGKNFISRDRIKLQWEAKPLGTPFDCTGLSESAYWLDTGIDGIERVEEVTGLSNDTYYKWRVRVKYDMVKGMPQRYSRWYYISDNAPTEVDLKIGSPVMINEMNINSMIVDDGIYLSVIGNGDTYVINKEERGKYISLGDMNNNQYTDKNPIEGMNEYRIDEYSNGKISNKAEIAVFYTSETTTNIEGFYTSIEKLNRDIKEQGLYIYDINGRKIKKIENPGAYYIIREIGKEITNTEKVIIIQ